ncbi:MAG: GNAT family N-acetyltransferase [Sphingobium sp.]|nr:GNAT family N-acetyltransferase [Sphingobium sp.]
MAEQPLDRPVWHALTGLQARHAVGGPLALRFHPEIGPLAAAASDDEPGLLALAALLPEEGGLATVHARPHPLPPGAMLDQARPAVQMIADSAPDPFDHPDIRPLGHRDAAEMHELALLTEPGPFAARTHELGQFWGIRAEGRLIAMAGERMRLPGLGEVSAVCVRPDARGRGLGMLMTRKAMSHIAAQGLQPFLHCYADNAAAIELYRRLGFRIRSEMVISRIRRA